MPRHNGNKQPRSKQDKRPRSTRPLEEHEQGPCYRGYRHGKDGEAGAHRR